MELGREIDLLMQTKTYMTQIAGFGLEHINEFDQEFKEALKKHIADLKHLGFIELGNQIGCLIETKDIKTYTRIEFLLMALEEEVIKNLSM
jgi:hypothetical protein